MEKSKAEVPNLGFGTLIRGQKDKSQMSQEEPTGKMLIYLLLFL